MIGKGRSSCTPLALVLSHMNMSLSPAQSTSAPSFRSFEAKEFDQGHSVLLAVAQVFTEWHSTHLSSSRMLLN